METGGQFQHAVGMYGMRKVGPRSGEMSSSSGKSHVTKAADRQAV